MTALEASALVVAEPVVASGVEPIVDPALERDAALLIKEYDTILKTYFAAARGPTTFAMDFSTHFKNYEFRKEHKMLPATLREGSVSCSSASLLVGRWWENRGGATPWYVLDQGEPDLAKQHVMVYLPKIERTQAEVVTQLVEYRSNHNSPLLQSDQMSDLLVDYLKRDGMRWMPAPGHYLSQGFSVLRGSLQFLCNRLALFNPQEKPHL